MTKCGSCETPCEKKDDVVSPDQLAFNFQDSISKGDKPTVYGYVGRSQSNTVGNTTLTENTNYHTLTDPTGDYLRTTKEAQVHEV